MEIWLDNQSNIYNPGQELCGLLKLSLKFERKIRGILVRFIGLAHATWYECYNYEHFNYKNELEVYSETKVYFNQSQYLIGSNAKTDISLAAGDHIYPFKFRLPEKIPSSFESKYGFIRYTVTGTLKYKRKADQEVNIEVFVNSLVDLNEIHGSKEPLILKLEKRFPCLWFESQPIRANITIPASGFLSGEIIPISISVDNDSDVKVNRIRAILRRIEQFTVKSPQITKTSWQDSTNIAEIIMESVETHSSNTIHQNFQLPILKPSNMYCEIIQCFYEMEFVFEMSGLHRNMIGSMRIDIGNKSTLRPYETTHGIIETFHPALKYHRSKNDWQKLPLFTQAIIISIVVILLMLTPIFVLHVNNAFSNR